MALELYNVSHAKRQARNAEKTRLTLRWLREELCSTAELVARRLGIRPPSSRILHLIGDKTVNGRGRCCPDRKSVV